MERRSRADQEWPDEEGGAQAQAGLRGDTGTSGSRPKEEHLRSADDADATGRRGPAGSGTADGIGHLGSDTAGNTGAPEAATGAPETLAEDGGA